MTRSAIHRSASMPRRGLRRGLLSCGHGRAADPRSATSRRCSATASAGRSFCAGLHWTSPPGSSCPSWGRPGRGSRPMLHILGMHDAEWTGEYELLGQPVHSLRAKHRQALGRTHIGFVFQSYHLLDDLTVAENLEVPLSYRNVPRSGASGPRRRHPRPVPDRRQEGPLSEPAIRRPAAARRRGARLDREADPDPGRRADRQPSFQPGS